LALSLKKRHVNSVQIIVFFYLMSVILSAILLYLPFLQKPGAELSFIDALFTAASAVSVTGLSVVPIHEVFNKWGILLLLVLFQIGGIGIMTLGTFFWLMFGQKIGLEQRIWIATDHNRPQLAGLVELMRNILILSLVIELAGTLLLGSYLLLAGYHDNWQLAYYQGMFTAVSAFTNAGFDLFGTSLQGFAHDYVFQLIIMVLIICGAIGFPVLIELKDWLAHRKNRVRFTFSLFTKITTVTFFVLTGVGTLLFLFFERNDFLAGKSWHESLFYALFQSLTTRSAGLTTMDISLLSIPTLFLMALMMFIGASPSSVGGGIRTTTLFVLLATVWANMRGYKTVRVFGRELVEEDILRSFMVFFVAAALVSGTILLLAWTEGLPIHHVMFEVCSAFGTAGLSTGITPELSTSGKLILIVTMVIGRIGIVNLLLFLKRDDRTVRYHYPKERVIIGQ